MTDMLVPLPWEGKSQDISDSRVEWIKELGKNVYCFLWQRWPEHNLPKDYDLYVVSFHLEPVDIKWLHQQSKKIKQPIIVLSDSNLYDCPLPDNVSYYKFYWWHHQIEQLINWFPEPQNKKITHKFSAICNRITQSKLLVTTLLLEHAKKDSMIKLSTWEGQDSRITTGNNVLDELYHIFYNKWYGVIIDLPDSNKFINKQIYSANPWTEIYQNCSLHFTNESFHYSYMQDELGHYVYPGPFITEKTLKCLVGATGFIPVGQYDTYRSLQEVGFDFSYNFDISFDQDSGNITRLEKLINLINNFIKIDATDLYNLTKTSSEHNQEHVYSNTCYNICESKNSEIINSILTAFA